MKTTVFSVLFLSLVCSSYSQTENDQSYKLEKKWETAGLDVPESVLFDTDSKVLYVSNVGGKDPSAKDKNGFISKIKSDGSIIELKWATGLDSPKGLALFKGILYVTDNDKIAAIDTKAGKITSWIPIEGAQFLNDLAVTKEGTLIVSDSKTKSYHTIKDNKPSVLTSDTSFGFPNGIFYDNGTLLSGIGDRIIKINPSTGKWENYILETGGIDGIQKVSDGVYIISDWSGRIHLVYPGKEKVKILDTTTISEMNAADICYDPETGYLYIPTFFGNSISCYKMIP